MMAELRQHGNNVEIIDDRDRVTASFTAGQGDATSLTDFLAVSLNTDGTLIPAAVAAANGGSQPPPARGVVCFTWDDLYASHATVAAMATARKQAHTFMATSDNLDAATYLTSAQVQAIYAAGHEIGAHSKTHAHVEAIGTAAGRAVEYDTPKTVLEALLGAGAVTTWAYPYGTFSATTNQELYLRYRRLFGTASPASSSAPWLVHEFEREDFFTGRLEWKNENHSAVLDAIRLAAVAPVVVTIYAHALDTGALSTAQVTEGLNLAQSLGVPCVRTQDAYPGLPWLRDPGFESGSIAASSWFATATGSDVAEIIADTPSTGFNGTQSLHLKGVTDTSLVFASQTVPVRPGQTVNFSGRVRATVTSGAGTGIYARIRERDYLGAAIGQTLSTAITATAAWALFSANRTLTQTCRYCILDLLVDNRTAEAWFDHCYFGEQLYGIFG